MGIDLKEQRDAANHVEPATPAARPNPVTQNLANLGEGLRALQWREILMWGTLAGVLMPLSLSGGFGQLLSFIAGVVPVGAGLLVGRRVKGHYGLHGFFTGLLAATLSLIILGILLFYTPLGASAAATTVPADPAQPAFTPADLFVQIGGFSAFSLLVFSTFGASMAGRSQERVRAMQQEVTDRGGRLERGSPVRTADDIRGMSLPQFGWYVNNLFKKQGFTFKDYRFIDKDKHLDLWYEYQGEPWHLRLSVADKVSTGTIEGLMQKMREEGCRKGVVITSTEFMPTAVKAAKDRPLVLIDGKTLYEIAEG